MWHEPFVNLKAGCSSEPLRVFLDTEFTQFLHIDLITLAFVPEDEHPT